MAGKTLFDRPETQLSNPAFSSHIHWIIMVLLSLVSLIYERVLKIYTTVLETCIL